MQQHPAAGHNYEGQQAAADRYNDLLGGHLGRRLSARLASRDTVLLVVVTDPDH